MLLHTKMVMTQIVMQEKTQNLDSNERINAQCISIHIKQQSDKKELYSFIDIKPKRIFAKKKTKKC